MYYIYECSLHYYESIVMRIGYNKEIRNTNLYIFVTFVSFFFVDYWLYKRNPLYIIYLFGGRILYNFEFAFVKEILSERAPARPG